MEAIAYPIFRAVLIGDSRSGKGELCDTFVNNVSHNQGSSGRFGSLPGSSKGRRSTERGRLRSRFHLKHVTLRHLQTGASRKKSVSSLRCEVSPWVRASADGLSLALRFDVM